MKKLINSLKAHGFRISVAESCTGGLISKLITDTPGASEVFDCAVTTYSNEAKMKLLGVKAETLQQYGAVSEQTAREMASGVKSLSNADIAVSVTGIAGPGGGSETKPVGTVCIGIATDEKCYATTFVFAGNRTQIRRMSAKMACQMALDELGITPIKQPITKKATAVAKNTINKIKKTNKKQKNS